MLSFKRFLRSSAAFTVAELLVVTAIVTSVSTTTYVGVKNKAKQIVCTHNLRQIANGLKMYEMTNGRLPEAAFFPGDPVKGKDSIRVIMSDYPAELFVCPTAPEEIAGKGLTFLWNDKCSGKSSYRIKNAKKTWLMIEVNAVSKDAPLPHPDGYNILYADLNTIKTEKKLPEDLAAEMEAGNSESEEE